MRHVIGIGLGVGIGGVLTIATIIIIVFLVIRKSGCPRFVIIHIIECLQSKHLHLTICAKNNASSYFRLRVETKRFYR